jgi:hypothetical protein
MSTRANLFDDIGALLVPLASNPDREVRWRVAYAFPYRRFARTLAGACAQLGADAVRYSFIVADLHHLLLAGFTGAPHAKVFDHARSSGRLRWRTRPFCLPLTAKCRHPG